MKGRQELATLVPAVDAPGFAPSGGFATVDGEECYRISAYHRLDPFLVSLPSESDLWMFVASGGGLTAGRVDSDGAIFPYVTVDKLHDAHHHTGPLTLIRIEQGRNGHALWEPFAGEGDPVDGVDRNLYKNVVGNRLTFEEIHHGLGLVFRCAWSACDDFGWVRTATLENRSGEPVRVAVMDGLRNVLPHGAPLSLHQQTSNLVDAYKKSEVDPETGLGIFSLTAGITDRAEALEVLRANTVWCCGLEDFRVHLSRRAVAAFRAGRVVPEEAVLDGERGNFLVSSAINLDRGEFARWHLSCDAGRDHLQVSALRRRILEDDDLEDHLVGGLRQATRNLRRIVASADGLQLTGRPEAGGHHFANVLFNSMRGGVFFENDDVPVADFAAFLDTRNREVADRRRDEIDALPLVMSAGELRDRTRATGDPDLARLGLEYLPLYFGRRHGDPSRPWNGFSIRVRSRTGSRELNYEGNWRDIFQNWEALCASFPTFLPSIVAKFVNASTVDGFNPYRIMREGVDWETVSTDDPWSNIGYWGDHQIIYLLRLLEAAQRHDPRVLMEMLEEEIFSYADVPYRIKPYADILRDASTTIDYDAGADEDIDRRVAARGTDGKLVAGPDGAVHHVNLLEKLLVPALSKLSNLIPGGGIWMNTQRPEWNDANNALGGGGVSVVTLCHLRRYLVFLADLLEGAPAEQYAVSTEVVEWFEDVKKVLADDRHLFAAERDEPRDRRRLMDGLGGAFSAYRDKVYAGGFTGTNELPVDRVVVMIRNALVLVEQGITANRRPDGLYHAYNLLEIGEKSVGIVHLQEMLEGQVAVLDSGLLTPEEALAVVEHLFASALFQPERRSFTLYPDRELPGFLARNAIAEDRASTIPLVERMLAAGEESVIARDRDGICRFQGDFRKAADVSGALDELARQRGWEAAVEQDREAVLDLFEEVFRHRSYMGRSGVMYGYEGLGCIYWHMVAKLLLAVQEYVLRAEREDCPRPVQQGLARMYFRIRSGIGYEKSVAEYGAFPTDPYSHTPRSGGAKQPGMTGQVKEEILTRFGELGVRVAGGSVEFRPALLGREELLQEPAEFHYFDVKGRARVLALDAGCMAFTVCQVPVVYEKVARDGWTSIAFSDGTSARLPGGRLDTATSAGLFARSGRIDWIRVGVPDRTFTERPPAGPDPANRLGSAGVDR